MIYLTFKKSNEFNGFGTNGVGRIIEYKFMIEGTYGGKYKYYFENKKYISSFLGEEGLIGLYNKEEVYVGKFFLIKISSKNPEKSEIYLGQEVTNKALIRKSGFTNYFKRDSLINIRQ